MPDDRNREPTLRFDPTDPATRDSRFLHDRAFLTLLRKQLEERLDREATEQALFQLGFFHGLRGALHLNRGPFVARGNSSPLPLLRMELQTDAPGPEQEGFLLRGTWPDRYEAEATCVYGSPGGCHCAASAGYTSGWLSGLFGRDLIALEDRCVSGGCDGCTFEVREAADCAALSTSFLGAGVASFPFEELRSIIDEELAALPLPAGREASRSSKVRVWGPLMIVPYGGPDETLRAISLLGQDPAVSEVSVIILDLCSAIIDEAFGAVALECILDAAAQWSVEVVLTGVSALSEATLLDLDDRPLIYKDLDTAIGAALQIATLQRQML